MFFQKVILPIYEFVSGLLSSLRESFKSTNPQRGEDILTILVVVIAIATTLVGVYFLEEWYAIGVMLVMAFCVIFRDLPSIKYTSEVEITVYSFIWPSIAVWYPILWTFARAIGFLDAHMGLVVNVIYEGFWFAVVTFVWMVNQ